jgi:hypothetical protein
MPTGSSRPARNSRRYDSIPITGQLDGLAHQVRDENVAASCTGEYLALCGHHFLAAPLVAPIGRPCPQCAAVQPPPLATGRSHHWRQEWRWWPWRVMAAIGARRSA